MLSLNKSYKNRKVSLTIYCKYKYFDSTVQRAEDRRQKFYFCRLPLTSNLTSLIHTYIHTYIIFTKSWQKFYFCRLPFAVNVKLNLSNNSTTITNACMHVKNYYWFENSFQKSSLNKLNRLVWHSLVSDIKHILSILPKVDTNNTLKFPCFDLWNCSLESERNGISETPKIHFLGVAGGGYAPKPNKRLVPSAFNSSFMIFIRTPSKGTHPTSLNFKR